MSSAAPMIDVPSQLSVDPDYPGYRFDAAYIGEIDILLDDHAQRYVVAYDQPAGTITRCCLNDDGNLVHNGEEFALETVHGRVDVRWQHCG